MHQARQQRLHPGRRAGQVEGDGETHRQRDAHDRDRIRVCDQPDHPRVDSVRRSGRRRELSPSSIFPSRCRGGTAERTRHGQESRSPSRPVGRRAPARIRRCPTDRCRCHPEPPASHPPAVAAGIRRWITSAPVTDLVYAGFGGQPPGGDTGALLRLARRLLRPALGLPARPGATRGRRAGARRRDRTGLVLAGATALGMVDAERAPEASSYRHLVVLGGLAHACLRRTRYAARLVRDGLAVAGEIAVLGSFRPLRPRPSDRPARPRPGSPAARPRWTRSTPAYGPPSTPSDPGRPRGGRRRQRESAPLLVGPDLPAGPGAADPGAGGAVRGAGRRRAHTADAQRFWAALARGRPVTGC